MKIFTKLFFIIISSIMLNALDLKHADSYEDAINEGVNQNKRVVLFAHSPFCPWCRKMEEDTLSNKEVIKELNEKFIFISVDLSVNIDIEDVPSKFIPRGTPTTYVINPEDQSLAFSMRGYKSPKSFLFRLLR